MSDIEGDADAGNVLAFDEWQTNGDLIADIARIGWLKAEDRIYDPTYGLGVFWSVWQPNTDAGGRLFASDINADKSPLGKSVDFTRLPYRDRMFDAVVFDPPYKLNGTPDVEVDARYGVDGKVKWQDRMDLIIRGVRECQRVAADRLLVKVQDQVTSGEIVWQTNLVWEELTRKTVNDDEGKSRAWRLADRFDLAGSGREQPAGRTQHHARFRPSTMLVFARVGKSTRAYR